MLQQNSIENNYFSICYSPFVGLSGLQADQHILGSSLDRTFLNQKNPNPIMLLGRNRGLDFRNRIRSLFTSAPSLLNQSISIHRTMASSHCTMRGAVGGLLLRFSDGVVSSRSILNSGNHHRRLLLTIPNSLSSLSSISTHTTSNFTHEQKNCTNRQVRKIWISSPLCMGRRSSKIAGRKVRLKSLNFEWLHKCFTTESWL